MSKNYYLEVIPLVHLPRSAEQTYTYTSDIMLPSGTVVSVSFRNKRVRGIVFAKNNSKPSYSTKPIKKVLTDCPYLSQKELLFAQKLSEFYVSSLPEIVKLFIPQRIPSKVLAESTRTPQKTSTMSTSIVQLYTQDTIEDDLKKIGSSISKALRNDGQILLLTPTITQLQALTTFIKLQYPQISLVISHSKLSSSETEKSFATITSQQPVLCIGLRHALFLPFSNLSLIVMYDSLNDAYKQWDLHPKYHAREVLSIRNLILPVPTILFSPIPSLADVELSKRKKIKIECAPNYTYLKDTHFLNLKHETTSYHPLVPSLQNSYSKTTLSSWLFFLNRKGYTRYIVCQDCGWESRCPHCDLILIKRSEKKLTCNRCDYNGELPLSCPQCKDAYIKELGIGVDALKNALLKLQPSISPTIIESETHHSIIKSPTVITTDTIFSIPPHHTFDYVVIVNADHEFSQSHWAAEELFMQKVWKLLAFKKFEGTLFIQTKNADRLTKYFSVESMQNEQTNLLTLRKQLYYPPFGDIFLLTKKISKNEVTVFPTSIQAFIKSHKKISYNAQLYTDKRGRWQRIIIRVPLPTVSFKKKLYGIVPKDWHIEINPLNI
jgi:primosomal protein N'